MTTLLEIDFENLGQDIIENQNFFQVVTNLSEICICCLSRNISFVNLNKCTHAEFFESIFEYTLAGLRTTLVCYTCHKFLKNISIFKKQVQESLAKLAAQAPIKGSNRKLYDLKRTDIEKYSTPDNKQSTVIELTEHFNEPEITCSSIECKIDPIAVEGGIENDIPYTVIKVEFESMNESDAVCHAKQVNTTLPCKDTLSNRAVIDFESVETLCESSNQIKQESELQDHKQFLHIKNMCELIDEKHSLFLTSTKQSSPTITSQTLPKLTKQSLPILTKQSLQRLKSKAHEITCVESCVKTNLNQELVDSRNLYGSKVNPTLTHQHGRDVPTRSEEVSKLKQDVRKPNRKGGGKQKITKAKPKITKQHKKVTKLHQKWATSCDKQKTNTNNPTILPKQTVWLQPSTSKEIVTDSWEDYYKTEQADFDNMYKGKIKRILLRPEEVLEERERDKREDAFAKAFFKCHDCIFSTNLEIQYQEHMKKKHGPTTKKYKCDICKTRVMHDSALYRHKLLHLQRFKCGQCDEVFRTLKKIVNHYTRHGETLPCYPKSMFGPSFVQALNELSRQEKPRKKPTDRVDCGECGRNVTVASLKAHLEVVHGKYDPKSSKKSYPCTKCAEVFRTRQKLLQHFYKQHTAADPNAYCGVCGIYFKSMLMLDRHLQNSSNHVGRKFVCDECGVTYATKMSVRHHIMTEHLKQDLNVFSCDQCAKRYKKQYCLRKHIEKVHLKIEVKKKPKIFVCEVCGKAFRDKPVLVSHLRTHTGERPYACDHCGATFGFSGALYTHKKLKHKDKLSISRLKRGENRRYIAKPVQKQCAVIDVKKEVAETIVAKDERSEIKFTLKHGTEIGVAKNQSAETGVAKNESVEIGVAKNQSAEIGVAKNQSAEIGVAKNQSREIDVAKKIVVEKYVKYEQIALKQLTQTYNRDTSETDSATEDELM